MCQVLPEGCWTTYGATHPALDRSSGELIGRSSRNCAGWRAKWPSKLFQERHGSDLICWHLGLFVKKLGHPWSHFVFHGQFWGLAFCIASLLMVMPGFQRLLESSSWPKVARTARVVHLVLRLVQDSLLSKKERRSWGLRTEQFRWRRMAQRTLKLSREWKQPQISGAKSGKISTNLKPETRYDGYDLAASCQLDSCHVACLVQIQLRRGVQCSPCWL